MRWAVARMSSTPVATPFCFILLLRNDGTLPTAPSRGACSGCKGLRALREQASAPTDQT